MIVRTPLKPIAIQTSLDLQDNPVRPIGYWEKVGWDDRAIDVQVCKAIRAGHYIKPSPYPLLKSYNGVTGQERRDGGNRWYAGKELGLIPWGKFCSICCHTKYIGAHNENYFRPCSAMPICRSCHRLIHRRFYDPNPWLQRAHEHAYPGAWFTTIAITELTREQSLYLSKLDNPFDARQLR